MRHVQLLDAFEHPEAGAYRPLGIVAVGDRRAEHGHHGVADELLDHAAVLVDPASDHRVIELEGVADVLRVGVIGLRGELDEIDEQHRDELSFLVDGGQRKIGATVVAEERPCRILRATAGTDRERLRAGRHGGDLTNRRRPAFPSMMEAAVIPPFEHFYTDHRDEVFGVLVKRLGRQRAEDAFQETFLRALRAYGALRHGEHLRAWVLTIARNVAVDSFRREKPTVELEEPIDRDLPRRPAYAELEHLTGELPPTERAAVVLRYAYDLPYAAIGAALGSSEEAARQAASAGVRRIRKKEHA